MNVTIKARHMDSVGAIKEYVNEKIQKLERIFSSIQNVEVILDHEAENATAEIIATASRNKTFVGKHADKDMYIAVDQCLHKVQQQVRRHKDKVRDRQGPPHSQTMSVDQEP